MILLHAPFCFSSLFLNVFHIIFHHVDLDLRGTGIPTQNKVTSTYCEYCQLHNQKQQLRPQLSATPAIDTRPADLEEAKAWAGFYLFFFFFKNCTIIHGVAQRASSGVVISAMAHRMAKLLPEVVRLAGKIWEDYLPPTDYHGKDGV